LQAISTISTEDQAKKEERAKREKELAAVKVLRKRNEMGGKEDWRK
jgi:hypothetical protein